MSASLAGMPPTWRLVSTSKGKRMLRGAGGWTAYLDRDGWDLHGPTRGVATPGPSGRTMLAPWAGGCEAVTAEYDARLAAGVAERKAKQLSALTAYLAVSAGEATVTVAGASDEWETGDDDSWGGASPSAGTYGGTGWTIRVTTPDGVVLWTEWQSRRADLAPWEAARPADKVAGVALPSSARPAWPESPGPENLPGWVLRSSRSDGYYYARSR